MEPKRIRVYNCENPANGRIEQCHEVHYPGNGIWLNPETGEEEPTDTVTQSWHPQHIPPEVRLGFNHLPAEDHRAGRPKPIKYRLANRKEARALGLDDHTHAVHAAHAVAHFHHSPSEAAELVDVPADLIQAGAHGLLQGIGDHLDDVAAGRYDEMDPAELADTPTAEALAVGEVHRLMREHLRKEGRA